jgi:hypothetical protein
MSYGETKVYFDGSHYIAIPHTTRPTKKRPKVLEETITVVQDEEQEGSNSEPSTSLETNENTNNEQVIETNGTEIVEPKNKAKIERKLTRKELFEELYLKYIDLKRNERKKQIIEDMLPYFRDREHCEIYVEINFERKQRNLICRRVRMCRKANLAHFNYFCTFTYDNNLHTEESFKHKLQSCFKMMCHRKGWKYMGVWERAPETNRLHFHGLFYIPDGALPGSIKVVKSYSTRQGQEQYSYQSTYFNERFGRSDFKDIGYAQQDLGKELSYLMKYIEKTGEKIVYSKNLPQYFISDIFDEDVVCTIGQEDKKLLLFDDFNCWDEGVLMGKVSPETISQMRKCN